MTIVVAMVVLSWPSGMSGNLMPTFPLLACLAIVAAVTVLRVRLHHDPHPAGHAIVAGQHAEQPGIAPPVLPAIPISHERTVMENDRGHPGPPAGVTGSRSALAA